MLLQCLFMDEPETNDPEPAGYDLSLRGEGVELTKKITRSVALQVINVALGGGEVPAPGRRAAAGRRTSPPPGDGAPSDRLTIGEYLETVNASSNPEKIVAFAVFLRDDRGEDTFTREDIKAAFRSAHESPPANFGRDFRAALSTRWIASDDEPSGRYFVTSTGTKAVESKFTVERKRKPRRKATPAADGDDA